MKKRFILFGANQDGKKAMEMLKPMIWSDQVEILCFLDNDSRLDGTTIQAIPVLAPHRISDYEYDKVIICPIFVEEITEQLLDLGVDRSKIESLYKEQFFSRKNRMVFGCPIGRYSYFKPTTTLIDTEIGQFCHIGDHCNIGLKGHDVSLTSTYPLAYHFSAENHDPSKDKSADQKRLKQKVLIKNDVYIGEGVSIMSGVTIGNGVVIGSKSFINKDVADYEIVGGIPARRIATRFESEEIEKLLKIAWWDWSEAEIQNHLQLLNSSIDRFLADIR